MFQVDPAVLQELPPDIREQIQKEMESRKVRKKPSTSSALSCAALAQNGAAEQGCSHWEAGDVVEVGRSVVEKSRDVIEALPSPSQVSEKKYFVGSGVVERSLCVSTGLFFQLSQYKNFHCI